MVHRLSNQIAGQIRRRYITTDRPDVVLLAIDDELKAGNAMARAGKWDDALNQWESVKMKKNASDRVFNIAVAYEMLAYGKYRNGGDMQAAFPLFTKAMDLYAQALQADPTEKYIQQAQARITRAKTSMEAAMKQYQAQSFEAGKVAQEIAARQKQETEINSLMEQGSKGDLPTPDSATDGKFRIYAREHLRNETGDPAREKIQAMLVAGKDLYGIEEDQGKRIVYQEIGRKRTHDKGVGLYRENLAEFAKDKRLDADQRAILSDISRQYGLSQQETSTLEQEAGVSSPAPKPNSLAPTTKPSTPTTKRKNTHPATAPKSAQSN
jgi:tetratricopeptide (TPR) repeat protein